MTATVPFDRCYHTAATRESADTGNREDDAWTCADCGATAARGEWVTDCDGTYLYPAWTHPEWM